MYKEPKFSNHHSYKTNSFSEKSYIKKMLDYSICEKEVLIEELLLELEEYYISSSNKLLLEIKLFDHFFNEEESSEEQMEEIKNLIEEYKNCNLIFDPVLIPSRLMRLGNEVQRIIDLFDDIYVICNRIKKIVLYEEKFSTLKIEIEEKIKEFTIENIENKKNKIKKDYENEYIFKNRSSRLVNNIDWKRLF